MDNTKLDNLRHSCAHLLAAAVKLLWQGTHNAIGPAIENGFYQDFDFGNVKISEEDLVKIENKMHELVQTWGPFQTKEVSVEQARKDFAENPYKLELLEEFAKEGKTITENDPGNFLDLCKGGHTKGDPKKELRHFKLLSVAGAYWRGSEKNKMLTRIYGTCFPAQEELDRYLVMLEEAKKRDHRKLGEQLEIFTTSEEVGPGLILWLPKGNIIKESLENWAKETEEKWGYQRVTTPHITKSGLFYTSGHLPYYKNDMYPPMKLENEEYFLKPMNCPFHHMIFKAKKRSYKELPLRLAEYGTVYRYEASGELFGLMRVRGMTQNDSHIYCTLDEAVEEFVSVMKLHEYYYQALGIKEYHLELALRDPKKKDKYHGDEKMWIMAEDLMKKAVAQTNIKMSVEEGNAAFYGPKIDFIVTSSIGREFAVSTNQIDLYMGERFNLKYVDKDGSEKTPVIIHRAPLGSHERFIGFLIEHYGGAFPLWLSPVQVQIIPIAERHNKYAQKVLEQLISANLRIEIDARAEKMQAKIRDAQLQKIPYMIIIGDREEAEGKIAVRSRQGQDLGALSQDEFLAKIKSEIESRL